MIFALILICNLGSECSKKNATDVIMVPDRFSNPVTCFVRAQAYVAETVIDVSGHSMKILCRPK